jgi:hypothetical protein
MDDQQDPGYYPYFPPVQISYSANARSAFANPEGSANTMYRFPETHLQASGAHGQTRGGGGGGAHAAPAAMHTPALASFHAQRAGYIAQRDALHQQRRELLKNLWQRKGELHELCLEYTGLEDMEDEEELEMGEGLVEVYNKQKGNKLGEIKVRAVLRRLEDELRVNMERIKEGRARQRELTRRARGGQ